MARKKKTEEQMEMFEVGGLKDEGGTVDPVSGNDVPPGSTQAEVRDDIPAQLSEGEFVLPADVVRYIGLENLMQLRAKAKEGLAKMEAMGQMGNAEEATMDDDIEYNAEIDALIDNFDPEDPSTLEFAEGGVVYAQQGAFMPGQAQPQQFSYGYMPPGYQQGQQTGYQPPQVPTTQFPDYSKFVSQPAQAAVGEQRGVVENRQYEGPNGELITILFIDGKPQQEIPANFKVYKPAEEVPEVKAPTIQQDTGGGGSDDREREEAEAGRMAQEKELNNLVAKYSPTFAEKWAKDPFNTGKLTSPYTALMAGIDTIGTRTDEIPGVLATFGIPVADFEVKGLAGKIPGNKYDIGKLNNTLKTADFLVESLGIDKGKIKDIISYTNLDTNRDGEVTKDDLVDKQGNLTKAGRDLFNLSDDGSDPADLGRETGYSGPFSSDEISAQQGVDDSPGYQGPSPSARDGSDNDSQAGSGGGGQNDGSDSGMDQGSNEDVSGPE